MPLGEQRREASLTLLQPVTAGWLSHVSPDIWGTSTRCVGYQEAVTGRSGGYRKHGTSLGR